MAFLLAMAGILLVYCELVWLGKVAFGVTGALMILAGTALFSKLPHTAAGMELIAAAVVCFCLEAWRDTYLLAAAAGSILTGWGFWQLCPAPLTIPPQIAFPASAVMGAITSLLLISSKRARRNKRADL